MRYQVASWSVQPFGHNRQTKGGDVFETQCSGHGRLCVSVCLCICLSLTAFPHYCMDPEVIGEMVGVPSSCALLGGFAIGARVSLLWQHTLCTLIALCTSNECGAEREMSASACTRSMPSCYIEQNKIMLFRPKNNSRRPGFGRQIRSNWTQFALFRQRREFSFRCHGSTGDNRCRKHRAAILGQRRHTLASLGRSSMSK